MMNVKIGDFVYTDFGKFYQVLELNDRAFKAISLEPPPGSKEHSYFWFNREDGRMTDYPRCEAVAKIAGSEELMQDALRKAIFQTGLSIDAAIQGLYNLKGVIKQSCCYDKAVDEPLKKMELLANIRFELGKLKGVRYV